MVGPGAKREAVTHLRAVMGLFGTSGLQHRRHRTRDGPLHAKAAADTQLRERLRELANARRRFGYRRLFVLLRQEGERSGKNRIYRLYREEGLMVRKRRARRRAVGTRAPILIEPRPTHAGRWTSCVTSSPVRLLAVPLSKPKRHRAHVLPPEGLQTRGDAL